MSIVVGVDPSLTCTGIATIMGAGDVATNTVKSPPRGSSLRDRASRLRHARNEIVHHASSVGTPNLIVIEAPAMGSARGASGHMHDRSGLWWLLLDTWDSGFLPVLEVPPACRAKYATGKGNSPKGAVIDAVARRYPHIETGGNDNIADALILASIGRRLLGQPIEDSLPATHLAALDKLTLPEGATP